MKIRNGFVSNSSSSSFLIISKNGKLTKDMLMKSFGVEKGAVLYNFAKNMAKEMFESGPAAATSASPHLAFRRL